MRSDEGSVDTWGGRSGPERWRVPLIASALVLASGLVLEAWSDESTGGGGGAALVVIGVAGALLSALLAVRPAVRPAGRRTASPARDVAGSAVLLALGLPAIVWAASGVLLTERPVKAATVPAATNPQAASAVIDESAPHTHAPGDTTHAASSTAAAAGTGAPATAPAGDPEFHTHGVAQPEQPLDPATRAELGEQLVTARDVALAYPTVADAEAAGYRAVTKYLPLIGAHYMRFANLVDGFDLEAPEMLLFDGTDPDSRIVGLSYFVVGGDGEPAGFVGPNDHWHQHKGLCLKGGFVVGGEKVTEVECTRRGGLKANDLDAWMVHAWVVPGWESPQGVFSPEHTGLV